MLVMCVCFVLSQTVSEEREKTAVELEERAKLAQQLEEQKKQLEEKTTNLEGDLLVNTFILPSPFSLPLPFSPSPFLPLSFPPSLSLLPPSLSPLCFQTHMTFMSLLILQSMEERQRLIEEEKKQATERYTKHKLGLTSLQLKPKHFCPVVE